jgi:alcohol dehydrogenase class IV
MTGIRAFSAPTRIVAGLGAAERLGAELEALGASKVAVACDEGVANAGLLDQVTAEIGTHTVVVLPLVRPDPLVADVDAAADVARAAGCDAVVGLGGGSALALAKAVALLLRNDSPITSYAGWDKAPASPAPSIALPTTAGSGSEVSNALVLHDPEQESIVVIRGHGYEPRVAILDGLLLRTLPRGPLMDAALDALSHAVEALSVRGASMFTDALAVAAADHLHETLPRVLEARTDDDLQRLLEASAMANLACGSSGLGLVHALSSATRLRVSHGRANGVLLPWVAEFNRNALRPRALSEGERILSLYEQIGFEPFLRPGELEDDDVASVIRVALESPLHRNNGRHATAGELEEILASASARVSAADVAMSDRDV